jgi:hypothetical protein
MARLPSIPAFEIRRMLEERRYANAIAKIMQELRAGDVSGDEQFLQIVDNFLHDLLRPPTKKSGGQEKVEPYWLEIGERDDGLRESLNEEGERVKVLCKEFPRGARSIREAIKLYKSGIAADEAFWRDEGVRRSEEYFDAKKLVSDSKKQRQKKIDPSSRFEHAVFMACQACDNLKELSVPAVDEKERKQLIARLNSSMLVLARLQRELIGENDDDEQA